MIIGNVSNGIGIHGIIGGVGPDPHGIIESIYINGLRTQIRLAERINRMRNHGASVSEEQRHHGPKPHLMPEFNLLGYNYRMTDMQAEAFELATPDHHCIRGTLWLPSGSVLGIIQIFHGLGEHHSRYARLDGQGSASGLAVVAHDHRGHGPHVGHHYFLTGFWLDSHPESGEHDSGWTPDRADHAAIDLRLSQDRPALAANGTTPWVEFLSGIDFRLRSQWPDVAEHDFSIASWP